MLRLATVNVATVSNTNERELTYVAIAINSHYKIMEPLKGKQRVVVLKNHWAPVLKGFRKLLELVQRLQL